MKNSSTTFDTIIVGSGINSLVAAALLARKGHSILLLERENVFGGCIRTDELTVPGFLHDTMSMAHPSFVSGPVYAALGDALKDAGLDYCVNDTPTGVILPDGEHLILHRSQSKNIQNMEKICAGDGAAHKLSMKEINENADIIFTLLSNPTWGRTSLATLLKKVWRDGIHPTSAWMGANMTSCRHWLNSSFQHRAIKALMAPWTLHNGLSPDSPLSALMTKVIIYTLECVGMPIPKGGNSKAVEAFIKIIEHNKGKLEAGADVSKILVAKGKAYGVQLSNGQQFISHNVICNVTPTQLYGRLLAVKETPEKIRNQASSYRYGKGNMQIHLALSQPPRWLAPELSAVSYLHLTGGVDDVSKAVNETERGLLPENPTICVAQPCAVDPSRAPEGKSILWIQLPECPQSPSGDAGHSIPVRQGEGWTQAVKETYADRIIDKIAEHAPDLKGQIIGRHVISPTDLEKLNINLVGGDPYGGACDLDQYMMWRPLKSTKNYETPIKNLWHIGASTHPGPGLGGMSGFLIAKQLGAI